MRGGFINLSYLLLFCEKKKKKSVFFVFVYLFIIYFLYYFSKFLRRIKLNDDDKKVGLV